MAVTLATVHAKALGGGIDPARACNVMIGEERASFSYPEINYNHFPISAVPILSRHTGSIEAERIKNVGNFTRGGSEATETAPAVVIVWPLSSTIRDKQQSDKLALAESQMNALEEASIASQCSIRFQRPSKN